MLKLSTQVYKVSSGWWLGSALESCRSFMLKETAEEASWVSPFGSVLGTTNWEETQNSLEGLYISSGLGMPLDAPGGAGECCSGEGWISGIRWVDEWKYVSKYPSCSNTAHSFIVLIMSIKCQKLLKCPSQLPKAKENPYRGVWTVQNLQNHSIDDDIQKRNHISEAGINLLCFCYLSDIW